MVEQNRKVIQCQCGYDRSGLDENALCPECGLLQLMSPKWHKRVRLVWRNCHSRWIRTGFVLAIVSCALGLANAAFAIYTTIYLMTPGFKGGTAGFILLYPPAVWIVIQLPIAFLTLIVTSFPAEKTKLKRYSGLLITISLCIPVIAIVLSFVLVLGLD